jgi:hypothetical protein
MIFLCDHEVASTSFDLSKAAQVSQVIIAIGNLCLATYVLSYQKNKDKKVELKTAQLNEQNIKLQWFKELIVQPNIEAIETFYKQLHTIPARINSNELTTPQKEDINNFVKDEASQIRKSFVDVLHGVDATLAKKVQENIDNLVDGITEAIFNDELKLRMTPIYDKHIGSKIIYSRNNLISLIFNYKGV